MKLEMSLIHMKNRFIRGLKSLLSFIRTRTKKVASYFLVNLFKFDYISCIRIYVSDYFIFIDTSC